jgi:N-acetylmuramoyl-L-alanine amidase
VGPTTGYYGALTTKAVRAFQTAHGLSAVGYVGPGTRKALNSL